MLKTWIKNSFLSMVTSGLLLGNILQYELIYRPSALKERVSGWDIVWGFSHMILGFIFGGSILILLGSVLIALKNKWDRWDGN